MAELRIGRLSAPVPLEVGRDVVLGVGKRLGRGGGQGQPLRAQ